MIDAREIAVRLSEDAEGVCRYLWPDGKKVGHEWTIGDVYGSTGESLKCRIAGAKKGVWCDFSNPDHKGDLLDAWMHARGVSLQTAIRESKLWLGIVDKPYSRPAPKHSPPQVDKGWQKPDPGSPTSEFLYLTETRKLAPSIVSAYRIATRPGEILFPSFSDHTQTAKLLMAKRLLVERPGGKKDIRPTSADQRPALFGWQAVPENARRIALTEGEIDCMTMAQYGIPALSVPYGGGSGDKQKWIEYEFDRMSQFDTIYLCLDMDAPGQEAAEEIARRLGIHRCLFVKLPHKDPNECLLNGVSVEEIHSCLNAAEPMRHRDLREPREFADQVCKLLSGGKISKVGLYLPFDDGHDPKVVFRPSETTLWSGVNGHGKSLLLGHLAIGAVAQGYRTCIASMEMPSPKLLVRMVMQAGGVAQPSEGYTRALLEWMTPGVMLYDRLNIARPAEVLEAWRYARARYGCTQFICDSLAKLGIDEDDHNAQKDLVNSCVAFAHDTGAHVHLVAHPRKAQDELQKPGKMDVRGTGALTDLVDNIILVWRNKPKEREIEKRSRTREDMDDVMSWSDGYLLVDKQRNGDWEGRMPFWLDKETWQYRGSFPPRRRQYTSYSEGPANG